MPLEYIHKNFESKSGRTNRKIKTKTGGEKIKLNKNKNKICQSKERFKTVFYSTKNIHHTWRYNHKKSKISSNFQNFYKIFAAFVPIAYIVNFVV
jgi:hypothetical protein